MREKHPVPTIEETLPEISEANMFSKLDLNMAFHQIGLASESRDHYKRPLFGVNMAKEKFQHIIQSA